MSYLLTCLQSVHDQLKALNRAARSKSIASDAEVRSLVTREAAIADSLVKLRGDFEIFVINGSLGRTREDRLDIAKEFWNVLQLAERTKVLIGDVIDRVESEDRALEDGSESESGSEGEGQSEGEIAAGSESVAKGDVETTGGGTD